MSQIPSHTLRRAHLPHTQQCAQQTRYASLLRRPHRPYTFTQLITLSDGSTYTARTTSPLPIYRSTKDSRNHPLWQPSLDSLRNVEQDEAGRLRAFRERFGRGWDLDAQEGDAGSGGKADLDKRGGPLPGEESLMDLISGAGLRQDAGESGREGVNSPKVEEKKVELVTVKKDGVLLKVPAQSRNERRK